MRRGVMEEIALTSAREPRPIVRELCHRDDNLLKKCAFDEPNIHEAIAKEMQEGNAKRQQLLQRAVFLMSRVMATGD